MAVTIRRVGGLRGSLSSGRALRGPGGLNPPYGLRQLAAAVVLENACHLAYIPVMRRQEVIAKLKETEPALRVLGVGSLYLFGSHARDEGQSDSDVDVFVDPAADRDFGFLPFMDAYEAIQKAFGDGVDIGYSTRTGLSPYILGDVEREAVRIF